MSKIIEKKLVKGENENHDRYVGEGGNFTSLDTEEGPGPMKCI